MARARGSLVLFSCVNCGKQEMVSGGNATFRCAACKEADFFHVRRSVTGKEYAGAQVYKAIRAGALPHPSRCQCADCGARADRYDHRDYNKPLDVDPVCARCNIQRGPAIPKHGAISFLIERGVAPFVMRLRAVKLLKRLGVPQDVLDSLPVRLTVADWKGLLPHLPEAA